MKRLVLDIETIPISSEAVTAAEETKKAALDALTGKIVCIGFIVIRQQVAVGECTGDFA